MVEERKRGKVYLIYTLMFLVMCAAAFIRFTKKARDSYGEQEWKTD